MRRGFTLWIGILLIGFVSVVIAATTSLVGTDVKQTADETADAQLRQLLLAGQSMVMEDLNRDGETKECSIEVPAVGRVSVRPGGEGEAVVAVEVAGRKVEQRLEYARRDGRWTLRNATLP